VTRIGVQLIFGKNEEPFLEAALRSVEWADYFCCVNTAPGDEVAQANEATIRAVVPAEKLRLASIDFSDSRFSFSAARNRALELADDGDYVLIVDADDVHWPQWEQICRQHARQGSNVVTAHFEHLCLYKDLRHSFRHREILWRKEPGVHFHDGVHEKLEHPRSHPVLADAYRYFHGGYLKPPREIAGRWEFYRALGAEIHEYDVSRPDDSMEDWPRVCEPFDGEHPPAVRKILEQYPPAPRRVLNPESTAPVVGLVLLTWNDAENLRGCLESLSLTDEPFDICVVDNGSTDGTLDLLSVFGATRGEPSSMYTEHPDFPTSLAEALNIGFGHFMDRPDIDYVGWIHPDMTFDHPDWLGELRHMLDVHPDVAKVGAEELDPSPGVRAGNSQCYLVRKWALERVGLFDERFRGVGGYEDWEHNARLLTVGRVLIWPPARITHNAMGTRRHHDTRADQLHNSQVYCELTGKSSAPV
jgi:glycosyltransferase involved in cell wall biosynthesis